MKTKMNLNGTTRKALVAAIAEITGEKAIYRAMPNEGQLPQYHAEGTHEAIIRMEDFEAVQAEME